MVIIIIIIIIILIINALHNKITEWETGPGCIKRP